NAPACGRLSIAPSDSQLRSVYTVPPSVVVQQRIWASAGCGSVATASTARASVSAPARAVGRGYGIGQGYPVTRAPRSRPWRRRSVEPVEDRLRRPGEIERVEMQPRGAAVDQAAAEAGDDVGAQRADALDVVAVGRHAPLQPARDLGPACFGEAP